jgi:hypothetical protein
MCQSWLLGKKQVGPQVLDGTAVPCDHVSRSQGCRDHSTGFDGMTLGRGTTGRAIRNRAMNVCP